MGRLAVILGSSAVGPGGAEIAAAAEAHGAVVLQRHAAPGGEYRLPHLIDHAANLRSLLEAGCERALAICSVGSLKPEIGVGEIVCPDDFIALQATVTTFADARGHATAGFDREWRASAGRRLGRGRRRPAARRRRLLADQRAALRDPGRDRPDRRPRRPGRDDAGLGVRRRRRARPALRGCLHGRQPGERDRVSSPLPEELERDREANAARLRNALNAVLPELAR